MHPHFDQSLIAQEYFSLVVTFPYGFRDVCISLGQESYSVNDCFFPFLYLPSLLCGSWNKSFHCSVLHNDQVCDHLIESLSIKCTACFQTKINRKRKERKEGGRWREERISNTEFRHIEFGQNVF